MASRFRNSTQQFAWSVTTSSAQRVGAVEMAAHDAAVVMIQPVNFVLVLVTINAFAVSMILLAQQAVVDAPC